MNKKLFWMGLFSLLPIVFTGLVLYFFIFIHKPVETDMIKISEPLPYDFIETPLVVSGEARGNWYFEASFPVKVYDEAGNLLGVAPIMAKDDWMTTNFVPFGGEINFSAPSSKKGYVVFQKDNPSGLPEYDAEVRVPVIFPSPLKDRQL